jgi:serine/threonine-protein kinase RsbW
MRRRKGGRLPNDHDEKNGEATREGWRRLQVRALREVSAAVDAVVAEMLPLGYSGREILAARVGLEEALVNAVKHGNREDPRKCVRVSYQVTARELVAEVVDEGPGFSPDLLPDPFLPGNLMRPCGRGVFLMLAYMTWVEFNAKGNGVTLCKRHRAFESPEQRKEQEAPPDGSDRSLL